MSEGIEVVFGGGLLAREFDQSALPQCHDWLLAAGVDNIDMACRYGGEKLLGGTGTPKRFTIDTKTWGGPNGATREKIPADA